MIRVLRRIFGPKRKKVRGGWGILYNEELQDLLSSPNTRYYSGASVTGDEMGGA